MDDRTERKHQFENYMAELNAQLGRMSCPDCQRLGKELVRWARDAFEYSERAKDLGVQLKRTHEIYAEREAMRVPEPVIVEAPKE